MRKLKVGVWIDEDYQPEMGGGYGYYTQLVNRMYTYSFQEAEIIFIANQFPVNWDKADKSHEIITPKFEIQPVSKKNRFLNKILRKLNIQHKNVDVSHQIKLHNDLIKNELNQVIDILYYPIPGCIIENFPFIYTLWDIGHLSMYAFPEVAMNQVFEHRKQHHDIYPLKALMVFCESEKGKRDAVNYLNINESRIKVVPIFPSEIINDAIQISKPLQLESDFFIHYPAQFWSHKNHYNLLLAFKELIAEVTDLKLIFTGSDKGNKEYIVDLIKALDLNDSVIDLGFVSVEELKWIYKNSQGMVMPTFLGPTNMPLLEAAALGCAVACSDLEGHHEQLNDYAYYFDPKNPNDIALKIAEMINDKKNGIEKEYRSNFNIDNALTAINQSFSEIKSIRFCWGKNDKIF